VVVASSLRLKSISAQRRRYSLNLPFSIPPSFNPQFPTILICPGLPGKRAGGNQADPLLLFARTCFWQRFNL
jgi:hypothetical protein